MRAIFYGTPEIAVPSLLALAEIAEIVGVVAQPDRPAGRGHKLMPPPVKTAALALGAPLLQPTKVKDGALRAWVEERAADVAVVIAYGRILPLDVLEAPRLGSLNLHASLLPKLRGSAPIQRAILTGETETGVCLMKMDAGMDEGPVLAERRTPITEGETSGSLAVTLGGLAASLLREELPRYGRGELTERSQDSEKATYAPPITNEECELDFTRSAVELDRHVRGLSPRPGAFTFLPDGRRLRLLDSRSHATDESALAPGTVRLDGKRLVVGTSRGVLELREAQVEGKKALPALDLWNGRVLGPESVLGRR